MIRGKVDKVHDFLVWDNARGPFAVYQDGWKLVRERERGAKGKVRDSLFHLPDDPAEEKDLAAMRPQKVRELLALHEDWRKRMKPLTPKQQQFADFGRDPKKKMR